MTSVLERPHRIGPPSSSGKDLLPHTLISVANWNVRARKDSGDTSIPAPFAQDFDRVVGTALTLGFEPAQLDFSTTYFHVHSAVIALELDPSLKLNGIAVAHIDHRGQLVHFADVKDDPKGTTIEPFDVRQLAPGIRCVVVGLAQFAEPMTRQAKGQMQEIIGKGASVILVNRLNSSPASLNGRSSSQRI